MSVTRRQHWRCHGLPVEAGAEMTVRGERGARFRFVAHCTNEVGEEWIDAYGGTQARQQFRSFTPDRVAVIHRTRKLRSLR